jgi:DnaJ homolog subfamily C member 28
LLSRLSLLEISRLRDLEWEQRERTYHDAALGEVNAAVRKYNGIAPYTVRRPYYTLGAELEKVYEECVKGIHDSIANHATGLTTVRRLMGGGEDRDVTLKDETDALKPLRIRDVIRGWLGMLVKRIRS